MEQLIPLMYTKMEDVLILRTEWAQVIELINDMISMEVNGRLCVVRVV